MRKLENNETVVFITKHLSGVIWLDLHQLVVVQKVDNAIHRITIYPADSVVSFVKTYPLDSNLYGG